MGNGVEQHQFANEDGEVVLLRSDEDDLVRMSSDDVREKLIEVFSTCCENVVCIADSDPAYSGEVFCVECIFHDRQMKYNIGAKGVTPGGNTRSMTENRIQPKGESWRKVFSMREDGSQSFWMGFYGRGSEIVYCAWEPKHTDADSPNSYKIDTSTIAGAYKFGFMREDRNHEKESVCAFKEFFFPAFLDNWELLLTGKKAPVPINDEDGAKKGLVSDLEHNLIFFGAPGTGKSYNLRKKAELNFLEANVRRITFHPDYSYAQFVGCYKPYMGYDFDENSDLSLKEQMRDGRIEYKFAPGPFVDIYVQAKLHPNEDYLLIIEEINRANTAAVFGDTFQLLDRKSGQSEYPIVTSEELGQHLWREFTHHSGGFGAPDKISDLYTYPEKKACRVEQMSLPPNMYIWATMNSADQGVFPMDTAFKRRWDFEYVGIDAGAEVIADKRVFIGEPTCEVNWDAMRRLINQKLVDIKVNEDKLIGPFFIRPTSLDNKEEFGRLFKNKILLYLFEDAAKTKHGKLFAGDDTMTYSQLCEKFDKNGVEIFKNLSAPLHDYRHEVEGEAEVDSDSEE